MFNIILEIYSFLSNYYNIKYENILNIILIIIKRFKLQKKLRFAIYLLKKKDFFKINHNICIKKFI